MNHGQAIITAKEFNAEISSWITVVKFWSNSCEPCNIYDKNLQLVTSKFKDRVAFCHVELYDPINSWNAESLEMKRLARIDWQIPHIVIFKDWEVLNEIRRLPDAAELEKVIEGILEGK